MERTRLQDLVIGLVVLGVGIFGIVNALSMPEGTKPYTLVVTIIFTALGALLTGRSIYYRKTPSHDSNVVHAKEMLNPMVAFILLQVYHDGLDGLQKDLGHASDHRAYAGLHICALCLAAPCYAPQRVPVLREGDKKWKL